MGQFATARGTLSEHNSSRKRRFACARGGPLFSDRCRKTTVLMALIMSSDVASVLGKLASLASERRAQVDDKAAVGTRWLHAAVAQITHAVQQLRQLWIFVVSA